MRATMRTVGVLTALVALAAWPARAQQAPDTTPPAARCRSCDDAKIEELGRQLDEARRSMERAMEALNDARESLSDDDTTPQDEERLRRARDEYARSMRAYSELARKVLRLQMQMSNGEMERAQREATDAMRKLHFSMSFMQPPSGYLGVTFSGSYSVESRDGRAVMRFEDYPRVESVEPDSPAEHAGIESRDLVMALDGRDVRNGCEPFQTLLKPGNHLAVRVKRGRVQKDLMVIVGKRPTSWSSRTPPPPVALAPEPGEAPAAPEAPGAIAVTPLPPMPEMAPTPNPEVSVTVRGAEWDELTVAGAKVRRVGELRDYFGVRDGLLVLHVLPGTPAERAGLRDGDVIQRVNGDDVSTPLRFSRALERSSGREATLDIVRKRTKKSLVLKWEP